MTVRQRHGMAVLAGLVLLLSRVFPATALPAIWRCPFQWAVHLPCPGCGLTRAISAIGHGDFAAAWALNPFAYVFYGGAVLAVFWPLVVRWRPHWEPALRRGRVLTLAALLLLGALCLFGLLRLLRLAAAAAPGAQPWP